MPSHDMPSRSNPVIHAAIDLEVANALNHVGSQPCAARSDLKVGVEAAQLLSEGLCFCMLTRIQLKQNCWRCWSWSKADLAASATGGEVWSVPGVLDTHAPMPCRCSLRKIQTQKSDQRSIQNRMMASVIVGLQRSSRVHCIVHNAQTIIYVPAR